MLKKILYLLLYGFVASVVVFALTRMIPISPIRMYLSAANLPDTAENVAWLTKKWGLDAPLYLQYFSWIKNFIVGDWGTSMMSGLSIRAEIFSRLPYTLIISCGGIILGLLLSLVLGFLSATKSGFWELLSRALVLLNQTIPVFVSAIVIIWLLGVKLNLVHFFTGKLVGSLIWSTLIFAVYCSGELVRIVAVHFRQVMKEPYIVRLYAEGFSRNYILLRHGLKPVLLALNGALISKFASILGGSAVVEFAFAIPGISYFLIQNIEQRDYMVIQSYTLVVILWMLLVHMIFNAVDLLLDRQRQA